MTGITEREAVEALAREVVADVSPAELPLFRATADRYFADPQATLAAGGKSDEALGFGAEAVIVLVGPLALDLAKRVLVRLVEGLGDSAATALFSRLRRDKAAEPNGQREVEPLEAAQLALIRETAGDEARRLDLPPEQAARLADAVVASLATRE